MFPNSSRNLALGCKGGISNNSVKIELNRNGNRRGTFPNSQKNLALGKEPNHSMQKDYSITRMLKAGADYRSLKKCDIEGTKRRINYA